MNVSSLFGIFLASIVVVFGILSGANWKMFIDAHAFIIVAGGTISATFISFPLSQILKIFKIFSSKVMGKSASYVYVIEEIINLSRGQFNDDQFLTNNLLKIQSPFLREAVELQIAGGIPDAKIDSILKKRVDFHFLKFEEESHLFKTVARFPPAFGLLGAVSGMIALMSGIASPDAFKTIGPSMAVALVATLYGIALANFILIPLGENVSKWNKEDRLMRSIVLDGLKLLRQKEHPLVVEEHLKSYLLSSDRQKLNIKKAS